MKLVVRREFITPKGGKVMETRQLKLKNGKIRKLAVDITRKLKYKTKRII